LGRDQVLSFLSTLTPCVVIVEACGGAHFWCREIEKLDHKVQLIPPACVKPFVKRQKMMAKRTMAAVQPRSLVPNATNFPQSYIIMLVLMLSA